MNVTTPENCGRSYCSADTYIPTYEDVALTASSILSFIHKLPNQHTLRLYIPGQANWFATALSTNQTQTLNTTLLCSVSLGPYAHSILAHTPNVRNISLCGWQRGLSSAAAQHELIAAIKKYNLSLEHLEVWNVMEDSKIADIARDIPTLTSVDLSRSNASRWDPRFLLQARLSHSYLPFISCFEF